MLHFYGNCSFILHPFGVLNINKNSIFIVFSLYSYRNFTITGPLNESFTLVSLKVKNIHCSLEIYIIFQCGSKISAKETIFIGNYFYYILTALVVQNTTGFTVFFHYYQFLIKIELL